MKLVSLFLSAIALLFVLTIFGGSWYTVDTGYIGVVSRNGAITGTAEPGLGFKLPIIDSVKDISLQSQSRRYDGVLAYSKDQQTAQLGISVNYRFPADQATTIVSSYGGEEGVLTRLVDRKVYELTKNVFGRYNAVTAIQDRARLVAEIQETIQTNIKGPVMIESVQLENIDFSDAYENSIEQRMLAEVEVQKLQQNAEREKVQAEITVTQAQAKADSQLAQAKANAESITLQGEAEASAIRAKGAALRDNPALVDLTKAERWDGVLPTTMVPNSTVPFLDMNK